MKNWRNVAILGFFLLSLGGIASWDEWQTKKDKEAENQKNRLTLLQLDTVEELTYKSSLRSAEDSSTPEGPETPPGTPNPPLDLKIAKKDGQWRIVSPIDYPADQSTVNALLKTLTDYAYTQEIPVDKSKWSDFGLDHPQHSITFHSKGSPPKDWTVFIGNKAPIGYNVYLRTSDSEKVFMGSQHLLVSANKTLLEFRDKGVVHIDENSVSSIRYERLGQPLIELIKNTTSFQMTQPEQVDTDEAEIKDFLAALNSLRAESIEDRPEGELLQAFSKPEMSVTWTNTSGESKTLSFIHFKGKFYASNDFKNIAFSLSHETQEKLRREPLSFRNRRILSTDLLNVKTIEIDGGVFENINGTWYSSLETSKLNETKTATSEGKAKEESHIRAFMVDLEFAKTDQFYALNAPEIASFMAAPPLHRLKISYNDSSKAPLIIDLFDANSPDKYLVRRSDKGTIFRVGRSSFLNMNPRSTEVKEKMAEPPPSDELPVDDSDDSSLNFANPGEVQPG